MSARPVEGTIVAILYLIQALLYIGIAAVFLIASGGNIILLLFAGFFALFFLILGIIGLIVFFGLWKVRRWGWIMALIFTIGGLLNGIGMTSDLLVLGSLVLSVIILILLILPNTRNAYL